MPSPTSFTGHRRRKTRWTVSLGDRVARWLIAVGGIGTIVTVSLVCVFLVWVVVPLFLPASVQPPQTLSKNWDVHDVLALGTDDYHLVGWMISTHGDIRVFRLDNGDVLQSISAEDANLTNVSAVSVGAGWQFGDVWLYRW